MKFQWSPVMNVARLMVLVSCSLQADYQLGLDAYQVGDFERAYSEWIKVAAIAPETVNPAILAETQYAIGMLYWTGQGVTQDTVASANWLRRAADMNHPGAQAKLGYLYSSGQGVAQSDFEAFKLLQMAAQQDDADAQYNLAVMYRDGLGVKADSVIALRWFRAAAANGDVVAAGVAAEMEQGAVVSVPLTKDSASGDLDKSPSREHELNQTENWIIQRKPEHYTIQVVALLQPDKLHEFIDKHSDWAPFAIYQQTWQGKPLWVLLQGDYDNADGARKAVQKFPTGLQERDNLWIRRFAMVQEALP